MPYSGSYRKPLQPPPEDLESEFPSINRVTLLGRLVKNPIKARTYQQRSEAYLTLETARRQVTKRKTLEPASDFHRVVVYDRHAEVAVAHLSAGSLLLVEGQISTSKHQDSSGREFQVATIIVSPTSGHLTLFEAALEQINQQSEEHVEGFRQTFEDNLPY